MHYWNRIALFCLCAASDKSPARTECRQPGSSSRCPLRWSMSVSPSPPAVDCRECQEAAAADSLAYPSLSRAETFQTLQCLSCAPAPLHLTVTSLLIPAVSCSLSPFTTACPFVLWNATCSTIFPFSLVSSLFLNLYFCFFTRWRSFWTFDMPHLSLLSQLSLFVSPWCCLQSPWSSPLSTFSLLLLFIFISTGYCPIK